MGKTGGPRPRSGRKSLADEKAGYAFSRALLARPLFRKNLEAKMDDGTVHPSILNTLFYYAYGKPAEIVETKQLVPVRIQHLFAPEPAPVGSLPEETAGDWVGPAPRPYREDPE